MTERSIDYCPQCRGIWLDRGKLDKIIERSERGTVESFGDHGRAAADHDDHNPHHGGPHRSHHGHGGKKSLWRELFD